MTTIKGLAIGGFDTAIHVDDGSGTRIEGNFIGTDASGLVVSPNRFGVIARSPNNFVGGTTAAARNLVSGNTNGVWVTDAANQLNVLRRATGTVVMNNLIGTSKNGLAALPNEEGVQVSVPNVTIGGTSAAERNVIPGNLENGVNSFATVFALTALSIPTDLLVQGNYIGVGADGLTAVPNGNSGLNLEGRTTIGGTAGATIGACTGACNVIAGNARDGIGLYVHHDDGTVFTSAATSQVMGNFIGINIAGNAMPNGPPQPNFSAGINVGVENVIIGGTVPQARNVISGNNGVGINVAYTFRSINGVSSSIATAAGSVIAGNYIGVGPDGTTARGNAGVGVLVTAPNVTIGGALVAARNIISGNLSSAMFVGASQADPDGNGPLPVGPLTPPVIGADIVIRNNYVGTDVTGTIAVPNAQGGLNVSAPRGTVDNNLISGNSQTGLSLGNHYDNTTGQLHASGDHGVALGNRIGVAANGNDPLPNTGNGISISAPDVAIGGNLASHRNIIAGNGGNGITINTSITNSNAVVASGERASIRGNSIGLTENGTAMLPNGSAGVSSSAANVTIGGPNPNDGNHIVSALNRQAINLSRQTTGGGTLINAGGSSTVQNNVLGLDRTGARLNARGLPLLVQTSNNQVLQNVIAGNGTGAAPTTGGIALGGPTGTTATDNVIKGNFIGTNAAGTPGLHNFGAGISVTSATGTVIGGSAFGERNVIVGSSANDAGVSISTNGGNVTGTSVQGNYIGVMPDGVTAQPIANRLAHGVLLSSSGAGTITNTTIGGALPGERNVIGSNGAYGVRLLNAGVSGTKVQGNYIGVGADGTTPLGNGLSGVWIQDVSDATIGGDLPAEGNLIAFNVQGLGMTDDGAPALRNRILSNRFHSHGVLAIEIAPSGANPNDAGDGDGGPNNRQNFPVLSAATNSPGPTTRVTADLTSFAARQLHGAVLCEQHLRRIRIRRRRAPDSATSPATRRRPRRSCS